MSASEPHFEPGPHAKLTNTDTEAFRVTEDFVFIDKNGTRWEAPAGTLTDGASIPQLFLAFTGGQLSLDFRAAAVVHDACCGVANKGGKSYQSKSWRQVHRVFYEACLTCGAPRLKALTMYAAVRLGGPRWEMGKDLSLGKKVPKERLVQEMKWCKTFIEEKSRSIDEVEEWMDAQESKMLESVG